MKKVLLLLLLILSSFLHAQRFDFNILTKYKTTYNGSTEREQVTYTHSDKDYYFLSIYKDDNETTARLYDSKNMKVHNFEVLETKSKDEVFFDFKYKSSRKLKTNSLRFSDYKYEVKTINPDTINPQVGITVFKDAKRTVKALHINCFTVKTEENLFHIFKFSCLHPYEFENIIPNGKYLVKHAKGITADNATIEYNLLDLKAVDFKLEIK